MKALQWTERTFTFGFPPGMLPFYLERLRGAIPRLREKTKDVSDEILSHPCDGKWSIKENIGHLAEVDEISSKRLIEITQGLPVMSPAFGEMRHQYSNRPFKEVTEYFETCRQKNLSAYKNLREVDLIKASLHPRLKVKFTPVDLAWFDAEHDDHHLHRISEIVIKLGRT